METINTVGELKKILSQYKDEDAIVIEMTDEHGDEIDIYPFYIDDFRINNERKEVRITQQSQNLWGVNTTT